MKRVYGLKIIKDREGITLYLYKDGELLGEIKEKDDEKAFNTLMVLLDKYENVEVRQDG